MSFKFLKYIIGLFKRKTSCPLCKSQFIDDSIIVLASSATSPVSSSAIMLAICPKCQSHSFVMAEASNKMIHFKQDYLGGRPQTVSTTISANEVIDMHNLLKEWKGDIKELLT